MIHDVMDYQTENESFIYSGDSLLPRGSKMKFNIINTPLINQDNYDKEIEEHYLTGRRYYLKPSKNDSVKAEGYDAGDFNGSTLFPEKFYLNTDLDPITGMIKERKRCLVKWMIRRLTENGTDGGRSMPEIETGYRKESRDDLYDLSLFQSRRA